MKAEYILHSGSDDLVVDAARVSMDKVAANYTPEQNAKLIKYLATHNHFTPFTHPQITLRLTVPIFVARQEFKHVIGFTRNEVSRRYVDDEPMFHTPKIWRARPEKSIKQGSGGAHPDSDRYSEFYDGLITHAMALYDEMIDDGVAPEMARMCLPQSMMTSYYLTGSLQAFARLYKLRVDPNAQLEIQELAAMIGDIIEPLYPVSWEALTV